MGRFQDIFHQSRHEQRRAVTNSGKGEYTLVVNKMYDVLPPPPEEHHEAIFNLNTIVQGTQTQSDKMEVLVQVNEVLTISNSVSMAQLAQINVTMNAMKAQLKTLALMKTNPTRTKRKFYCWSYEINYNHWNKTYSSKKAFRKEDAYCNKKLGGSKKRCK